MDKYNLKKVITGKFDSVNMILDKNRNTIISALPANYKYSIPQLDSVKSCIQGQNDYKVFTIGKEDFFVVYDTSEYNGWMYVSVVPVAISMENMSELSIYVILFFAMTVMVALVLILLFFGKVYRKINRIILFMNEVEKGNFNISIQHNDKDEFGYMYTSFNNMVSRIKELFEQLYEHMMLQKDAELKLLQSKINPHFIYNIFDNMNWLIELERFDELESLVSSVSTYFKSSLNVGKDFISISNTIKQLESYVQIQKIRFGNRFNCIIDFDDEILDMLIPNFTLQPLVENAICHGIEPKIDEGLIQVKGVKINNRVFFTVEDNGFGIKSDKLNSIIKFLESDKEDDGNYFAIANINKRIKLHYGNEYGLVIKSKEGIGTKVTVIIPANNNTTKGSWLDAKDDNC
jgi:two-component system sensor histidine kinase YesM